MDQFLFINIIITGLNLFVIVYAYSLSFFPKKWRKKVDQDSLVGLTLIFMTMLTMFTWIIYFYFDLFKFFEDTRVFYLNYFLLASFCKRYISLSVREFFSSLIWSTKLNIVTNEKIEQTPFKIIK